MFLVPRWWPVPVLLASSRVVQNVVFESRYDVSGHAAEHLASASVPFAAFAVGGGGLGEITRAGDRRGRHREQAERHRPAGHGRCAEIVEHAREQGERPFGVERFLRGRFGRGDACGRWVPRLCNPRLRCGEQRGERGCGGGRRSGKRAVAAEATDCEACGAPVHTADAQKLRYLVFVCHEIKRLYQAEQLAMAEADGCLADANQRIAAVRRKLDPDGRFSNAYLDRVLGPR